MVLQNRKAKRPTDRNRDTSRGPACHLYRTGTARPSRTKQPTPGTRPRYKIECNSDIDQRQEIKCSRTQPGSHCLHAPLATAYNTVSQSGSVGVLAALPAEASLDYWPGTGLAGDVRRKLPLAGGGLVSLCSRTARNNSRSSGCGTDGNTGRNSADPRLGGAAGPIRPG